MKRKGLYLPLQLSCHDSCALWSDGTFNYNHFFDSHPKIHRKAGQSWLFLSDNGRNFPGARKQIQRQPLKLDHEFIWQKILNQSVEWRLKPPSALQFGVVWERLVQIVKLLLNLGSAKLTWDAFPTIFTETESLVNPRPLTHVRRDVEDEDPLTSNFLLIGRALSSPSDAEPFRTFVFNENPTVQTKTWIQARQRLESIWKSFLREYVPTLNARNKWTKP